MLNSEKREGLVCEVMWWRDKVREHVISMGREHCNNVSLWDQRYTSIERRVLIDLKYTVIQTTSYSGVPKSSLQTTIAEAMVCIKMCQVILTTIADVVVCKCAKSSLQTTVAEVVVWESLQNAEPFVWVISVESWPTINLCGNSHPHSLKITHVWHYTCDFTYQALPLFSVWHWKAGNGPGDEAIKYLWNYSVVWQMSWKCPGPCLLVTSSTHLADQVSLKPLLCPLPTWSSFTGAYYPVVASEWFWFPPTQARPSLDHIYTWPWMASSPDHFQHFNTHEKSRRAWYTMVHDHPNYEVKCRIAGSFLTLFIDLTLLSNLTSGDWKTQVSNEITVSKLIHYHTQHA